MYNDSKIIGIYKTSSDYSSISRDNKDVAGNSIIIEEEINQKEKVVVYNYKTNTKYTTKISPTDFTLGKLEKVVLNDNVIGLIVNPISTSDSKTAYYSLEKKKPVVTFSNEYKNANELKAYESYTEKGYLIKINKKKDIAKNENAENSYNETETTIYSLIDIKTGKEIEKSILKDESIYTESNGVPLVYTNGKHNYLDEEFNKVFDKAYYKFYKYNDKIYAYSYTDGYAIYNIKTKELSEKNLENIVTEFSKYFATYSNNMISVYDADTGSIIKEISYVMPEGLQVQSIGIARNKNDKLSDGIYLFVGFEKCNIYKINENNNSVDFVKENSDYCGY